MSPRVTLTKATTPPDTQEPIPPAGTR